MLVPLAVGAYTPRCRCLYPSLTACDGLCTCKSADRARVRYSHECRAALPPGSHCRLAKPARAGSNWASGVVDEYFEYKATQYSRELE